MAEVVFKNVYKTYPGGVAAVRDFNLTINDKEFVVFVGPSGCGKSTSLRMVAGLEEITKGEIFIDGRLVNNVLPKDRDISMVFQNYALYPHMTVYNNIAFPLKMRKMPRAEIKKRVNMAADILEIADLLKRKPKALSGGQRQRVAIGRAIVREPKAFLMDEPLSNLDAKLRNQMRSELIKLRQRLNTTFIYVTHDQTEAMTLGDRIVVMNDGLIMQVGTPSEVFNRPENIFVAGFIGTPQMNFIDAELKLENGVYTVSTADLDITPSPEHQKMLIDAGAEPQSVTLGVRPEHLHLSQKGIAASADMAEITGSTVNLHSMMEDTELVSVVNQGDEIIPKPGMVVHFMPDESKLHIFSKLTGRNLIYGDQNKETEQKSEERPAQTAAE